MLNIINLTNTNKECLSNHFDLILSLLKPYTQYQSIRTILNCKPLDFYYKFAMVKTILYLIFDELHKEVLVSVKYSKNSDMICVDLRFSEKELSINMNNNGTTYVTDVSNDEYNLCRCFSLTHLFELNDKTLEAAQSELNLLWKQSLSRDISKSKNHQINFVSSSKYKFEIIKELFKDTNISFIHVLQENIVEIQGTTVEIAKQKASDAFRYVGNEDVLVEDSSLWLECIRGPGPYLKAFQMETLLDICNKFDNNNCYYQKIYSFKNKKFSRVFCILFKGHLNLPRGTNGMNTDKYFELGSKTIAEMDIEELVKTSQYEELKLFMLQSLNK